MPRRNRRDEGNTSATSTVLSVLSVLFFIGLAVGVVVLRAQRRAARNDAIFGRNDDRGGGEFNAPQPNNPFPMNPQQPKALAPGTRETQPVGGFFAQNDYREYRQDGALLIGFDIGLGAVPDTAVVTYLRPIWLTAKGEQYGTAYGRTKNPIVTEKARDGYAIGGIAVKGGGAMEGICFTYMKRGAKHLIADDYYISNWHGEQTRKLPENALRNGDGEFVVGIFGKRFDDKGGTQFDDSGCIGSLGLILWVKE